MTTYQPTSEQEKAIREWLQEAIVPLIEQVLVKKLGQAMSFAAQEVIKPQRTWVGLTDEEIYAIYGQAEVLVHDSWVGNGTVGLMFPITLYKMFEAKLKEKNT